MRGNSFVPQVCWRDTTTLVCIYVKWPNEAGRYNFTWLGHTGTLTRGSKHKLQALFILQNVLVTQFIDQSDSFLTQDHMLLLVGTHFLKGILLPGKQTRGCDLRGLSHSTVAHICTCESEPSHARARLSSEDTFMSTLSGPEAILYEPLISLILRALWFAGGCLERCDICLFCRRGVVFPSKTSWTSNLNFSTNEIKHPKNELFIK